MDQRDALVEEMSYEDIFDLLARKVLKDSVAYADHIVKTHKDEKVNPRYEAMLSDPVSLAVYANNTYYLELHAKYNRYLEDKINELAKEYTKQST